MNRFLDGDEEGAMRILQRGRRAAWLTERKAEEMLADKEQPEATKLMCKWFIAKYKGGFDGGKVAVELGREMI